MRPTKPMVAAARQALEWYGDHPQARGLVERWQLRFARSVTADKTFATVNRVVEWHQSHEHYRSTPGFFTVNDDGPTAERLAWDLLGGDPAVRWAADAVESIPVEEHEAMSDTLSRLDAEADAREALVADGAVLADGDRRPEWGGVLALEGIATSDNRLILPGALGWRELPITLQEQIESQPGHDGALAVGPITSIERVENGDGTNSIMGEGLFDQSEEGMAARGRISSGSKRGVSVDQTEVVLDLPDDPEALEEILFGDGELRIVEARIGAATLVVIPAFEGARLQILGEMPDEMEPAALVASGGRLDGVTLTVVVPVEFTADAPTPVEWYAISELPEGAYPGEGEGVDSELYEIDDPTPEAPQQPVEAPGGGFVDGAATWFEATTLVASGAPRPPAGWFEAHDYSELTPVVIEEPNEAGLRRIHGHAAGWGSCHIGFSGRCVDVPRGLDYSSFQGPRVPGHVTCDNGESVKAGPLVMDTVHPNLRSKASDAAAHYAHTGCLAAQVRLSEDRYGLQLQGWVMPGLSDEHLARLAASDYSPDWRPRASADGGRGVVAVLAVPVSGFNLGLVASAGAQDDETEAGGNGLAIVGSTWTPRASAAAAHKVALLTTLGQPVPEALAKLAAATEAPEVSARKQAVMARLAGQPVEACDCGGACCG